MTALERHCRLLLLAYPAAYRRDRGEEITGTLLEATPEGRSWPPARDIRSLVMGGFRARAAQNRRLPTAANLRIAALVGVVGYLAFSAIAYLWVALVTLTAPTGRPAGWLALAIAALVGTTVALAWVSSRRGAIVAAALPAAIAVSLAGAWRPAAFGWPIIELASLAAAVLLARGERPGDRWLWGVGLVAALPLVSGLMPGVGPLVFGTLLVVLGIGSVLWVVIDARPAIAAAVFLLAFWLPTGIDNVARGAGLAAGVPPLVILSAVAAVGVWRLHRQSARLTARDG